MTTAFEQKNVIIQGTVKFSNISEAKSFKLKEGGMSPPRYELVVTLEPESPDVTMLEDLHKQGVELELARIPKAKQRTVVPKPVKLEVDVDKDGNETGLLTLKLTRPERRGKPVLVDGSNEPIERRFIRSGSEVKVQATFYSYYKGGNLGTTMTLEAIQLVKEAEGTGDYTPKPVVPMFDVLSTDSPF